MPIILVKQHGVRWQRFMLHLMAIRYNILPRWIAHWWAKAAGYFWLPCPDCGRNFGGQEWAHHPAATIAPAEAKMPGNFQAVRIGIDGAGICPKCSLARLE